MTLPRLHRHIPFAFSVLFLFPVYIANISLPMCHSLIRILSSIARLPHIMYGPVLSNCTERQLTTLTNPYVVVLYMLSRLLIR